MPCQLKRSSNTLASYRKGSILYISESNKKAFIPLAIYLTISSIIGLLSPGHIEIELIGYLVFIFTSKSFNSTYDYHQKQIQHELSDGNTPIRLRLKKYIYIFVPMDNMVDYYRSFMNKAGYTRRLCTLFFVLFPITSIIYILLSFLPPFQSVAIHIVKSILLIVVSIPFYIFILNGIFGKLASFLNYIIIKPLHKSMLLYSVVVEKMISLKNKYKD